MEDKIWKEIIRKIIIRRGNIHLESPVYWDALQIIGPIYACEIFMYHLLLISIMAMPCVCKEPNNVQQIFTSII